MTDDIRVERRKLTDVLPDSANANRHRQRGQAALERSLRKLGFFRPTAAFGKDVAQPVMGAGNLTQETAVSIGMDEAIFVFTDGSTPIVHVRTDIAPGSPEAHALAIEDNRIAEISLDWDVETLLSVAPDELLTSLWEPDELSDLGAQIPDFAPVDENTQPRLDQKAPVTCPECGAEFVPK